MNIWAIMLLLISTATLGASPQLPSARIIGDAECRVGCLRSGYDGGQFYLNKAKKYCVCYDLKLHSAVTEKRFALAVQPHIRTEIIEESKKDYKGPLDFGSSSLDDKE